VGAHSRVSGLVWGRKVAAQRGLLQPVFGYLHIPGCRPGHRCDESQAISTIKLVLYSTLIFHYIMPVRPQAGLRFQLWHHHRPAQFVDGYDQVVCKWYPVF